MTFFDQLKNIPAMTEAETADMAEQLCLEIKGSCLALKRTGEHRLIRVYGWNYHIPPAWQQAAPKYFPVCMGRADEVNSYGIEGFFAACTGQNRDRILSRLSAMLRTEGFPSDCISPVSARLNSGEVCCLIRIDLHW